MNLDEALEQSAVWRGRNTVSSVGEVLPTGFACLDELLAGGGWPGRSLTEILIPEKGIGELRLVMPALAHLGREKRWLAWVAPPYVPYAPMLAAYGIDLARVLVVRPQAVADGFWAVEQALRSGTCAAVLAWPAGGNMRVLRRLQLAAEKGHCWGILFRDERAAHYASPAALRIRLQPLHDGLAVHIVKQRGYRKTAPAIVRF